MRGVLTLAGEGSRMLPWSRGLRKEFLPLYDRGHSETPVLKPVANLVFETLAAAGVRDFVLVVGGNDRGTTARKYFTIDPTVLERSFARHERLAETTRFYETLSRCRVRFALQPTPRGFGDAVLRAAPLLGSEPFFVHAADGTLLERRPGELPAAMARLREREDLDAVLLVRKVANPRNYGVVEGRPAGREGGYRQLKVTGMEEKPTRPRSRWAATAVYAFGGSLLTELARARREAPTTELELTTGIVRLLAAGANVGALVVDPRVAEWRSVGSPEGYVRALLRTRTLALGPGWVARTTSRRPSGPSR